MIAAATHGVAEFVRILSLARNATPTSHEVGYATPTSHEVGYGTAWEGHPPCMHVAA